MIDHPKALSALVITRVVRILSVNRGRTHWDCRNREHWAIVVRESGKAVFKSETQQIESNPETVLILPEGISYSFDVIEDGTYILLEFDAEQTGSTILSLPIGNAEKIRKILHRMDYNKIIGHPYHALEQIHGTYEILLTLLRDTQLLYVQKDKQRVIEQAAEYISTHYASNLTNSALAKRCGISEVYFRKLFTQITGNSPITYLHKIRIASAAKLLQEGTLSLSEIATSVGYTNLYHFSSMFKKYMGLPPSKYARLFKAL
ncbi:MAG: helix-turn-helix transcriptional regulator [Ruminococcaceae bacterium]|nr:helix-turn-helix transcriptional regulator [Oscillospiraceae bacterium]